MFHGDLHCTMLRHVAPCCAALRSYHPWRVRARNMQHPVEVTNALPWNSPNGPPMRMSNNGVFTSDHLIVEFNFMSPNQLDAWMNVAWQRVAFVKALKDIAL